ncbi:MAG: S1-like domain-containing RNA-binding protein [Desulfocapsaceae bacterium]|jgi:predicted RNA-binding protein (virulence factor B family)|nr:S1-like domain-containing RNA-binding protein [Desulfocapsaceae bacterium]
MAQIGRINKLTVKSTRDYGVHLDGGESGDILLPGREVLGMCQVGDAIEVFVYVDREDRLRATTQWPKVTVGQFARLPVVSNSDSGTYLDWGLELDLFVPQSEQKQRMREGRSYVVFVFLDVKTNRITASSRLDKFLSQQPPDYEEGEEVDLIIYEKTDLGYRVVVNLAHEGMLYENEVFQKLTLGQELKGYIRKIREDLKIDLLLQRPGYQGVDAVSQSILTTIEEHGGRITVTDKSQPEEIYSLFGVSKKTFKKAIGALYKKRLILIDASGIELIR